MDNPAALQVGPVFLKHLSFHNFQLRYLQTLNSISAENNSTIIFPVPVDILSSLMGQGNKKVGLGQSWDSISSRILSGFDSL